jgi:hypothetical protein
LLEPRAALARGLGEAERDGRGIAVAGIGLPQHGAEAGRIDPGLHARDVRRRQHLGPHTEGALPRDRAFQHRPHGRSDADETAAGDVARLTAHGVAEALKDRQGANDHLRRLGRGIELAHDADRAAGAAGGQRVALEQKDVADAAPGEVERDGGAGDAAADDDDAGGTAHGVAAAMIPEASASLTTRTWSPGRSHPSRRTRA